jgi:hypothetical protein
MAGAPLTAVVGHLRNLTAEQRQDEQTDGELLRTFLRCRDQAAFAALVRRHGPMVLRVCRRALGNAHDAEDALQATFLVLARQAASIRKKESLGHAVRRHEVWAASGELGVVTENSDFIKLTGPELWLPRHCRAEWHTSLLPGMGWKEFTREPAVVVNIQATRLERSGVDPGTFTLDHTKPGMDVVDYGLPGAEKAPDGIHYTVPADPANAAEAVPAAQRGQDRAPPRRHVSLWIAAGLFAAGALAGALALLRRRRQPGKEAPREKSPADC